MAETIGGKLLAACRSGAIRDELFTALMRQLDVPGKTTVLAIEDIHWAHGSTLDLPGFLGLRVRDVPVLLIATYRDDELALGDPLRQVLGDLATQRTTRRIDVAPLSEKAVAVLAGDTGLEPAELFRLTGGNPFFVTEILRSASVRIPQSARDAVLARVARLTLAARQAIGATALIGGGVAAQREPARIAPCVGAASFPCHGREANERLGPYARLEHRRPGEPADVVRDLEAAERAGTFACGCRSGIRSRLKLAICSMR
jgi:hypothetical protein